MGDTPPTPHERLIDFYLEDATDRLRFQQEFSIEGFKTLILINGGAVIALLTYVGNAKDRGLLGSFEWAFGGYVLGVVAAVLAYLAGYAGQALIMRHSSFAALAVMGVHDLDEEAQTGRETRANRYIAGGIGLCVLSLIGFVGGSIAALCGLS
jgi:hypothetical protein